MTLYPLWRVIGWNIWKQSGRRWNKCMQYDNYSSHQGGHLRKYLKCTLEKMFVFDCASSPAKQLQPVTSAVWLCILSSRIFWENIWNKQKRKCGQAPKAGRCASEPNATEGYWPCLSIGWIGLIEWIGWILWIVSIW